MTVDSTTGVTLLAIGLSTVAMLLAFAVGYGKLQAQVREVQRRQDVTNGRLLDEERAGARTRERISHMEGQQEGR